MEFKQTTSFIKEQLGPENQDTNSWENQWISNNETFNSGRWTKEEHKKFIDGILEYGNEWKKVQNIIKTRSSTQARSHAQKFFLRIKKNLHINNSGDKAAKNDNFSIKYFFELLASQEKASPNWNGKLTSSQSQKLLEIVSKFSDDSILFGRDDDKDDSDDMDEWAHKITTAQIFDIKKDRTRRQSLNLNAPHHKMSCDSVSNRAKIYHISKVQRSTKATKQSTPRNDKESSLKSYSISDFTQYSDNINLNPSTSSNQHLCTSGDWTGKKRKPDVDMEEWAASSYEIDFTASNPCSIRPRYNSSCFEFDSHLNLFNNFDSICFCSSKVNKEKKSVNNPFCLSFDMDDVCSIANEEPVSDPSESRKYNGINYDNFTKL